MAGDDDLYPWPRRVVEFVVFGTADIDPALSLKPGYDLVNWFQTAASPLRHAYYYAHLKGLAQGKVSIIMRLFSVR